MSLLNIQHSKSEHILHIFLDAGAGISGQHIVLLKKKSVIDRTVFVLPCNRAENQLSCTHSGKVFKTLAPTPPSTYVHRSVKIQGFCVVDVDLQRCYVVHPLLKRVKQTMEIKNHFIYGILKMFLKSFATTSVKFYTLGHCEN